MPVMKLPSGRWRVQIRRKGLPTFDKVVTTEQEARELEKAQLELPQRGFLPAEITLDELWTQYKSSSDFRAKAPATQTTERTRIKPVLKHLGGYALKYLEQAPSLIYDFIDAREQVVSKRTKQHLSSTSRRLEIAALSAVIRWAKKRNMVRQNFVRVISRPGQAKRRRRVSPVETAKVQAGMKHSDPKVQQASRFIYVMRLLGCRPGELARLRWQHVSWKTADALFTNTKYKGEDRKVHLVQAALQVLREQQSHWSDHAPKSPFVFTSHARSKRDPEPFKPFNFSGAVKVLREHGVVEGDFHAHATRREYVSRAIEEGVPYATIGKQTGHRSIAAIQLYDQGDVLAKTQRAAVEEQNKKLQMDVIRGAMELAGFPEERIAAFERGELLQQADQRFFTTNAEIMRRAGAPSRPEQIGVGASIRRQTETKKRTARDA